MQFLIHFERIQNSLYRFPDLSFLQDWQIFPVDDHIGMNAFRPWELKKEDRYLIHILPCEQWALLFGEESSQGEVIRFQKWARLWLWSSDEKCGLGLIELARIEKEKILAVSLDDVWIISIKSSAFFLAIMERVGIRRSKEKSRGIREYDDRPPWGEVPFSWRLRSRNEEESMDWMP